MEKNWILKNNYKKLLKVFHLLLASSVFGGLISIASILLLKKTGSFGGNTFPIDLGLLKIFTWGTNYAFIVLVVTSFIYGLFTEWGFIKHRWIIFKWTLMLAMFAVTWVGLGPAINGMASISDAGLNTGTMSAEYSGFENRAFLFTTIEIAGFILISLVSVFKPWGMRKVKKKVKQKTILMVLLPTILIGVGYSVFNTMTLNKIRNMPIAHVDLSKVPDGIYQGEAKVGSFVYKVKVEVKDHKILNAQGVDNRKSPYVTYAEGVFTKMVQEQRVDVDAVTGATTTSKAFMKAVENALKR